MATLTLNKKASEWITATGRLQYNPPRPGLKRNNGDWWAVVNVPGLADYLRWLLEKNWWNESDEGDKLAIGNVKVDLQPPSWQSHISLIRGEMPRDNIEKWGWKNGKEITFSYSNRPRKVIQGNNMNTEYWVCDVISNEMQEIRSFYNLETFYKFHLTIGRREL
jgi:hypothetical protein